MRGGGLWHIVVVVLHEREGTVPVSKAPQQTLPDHHTCSGARCARLADRLQWQSSCSHGSLAWQFALFHTLLQWQKEEKARLAAILISQIIGQDWTFIYFKIYYLLVTKSFITSNDDNSSVVFSFWC